MLPQADAYTRWYRQDANRIVQSEAYEGTYHHHRRIRVVCGLLARLGVRRVLDLGCGDGWQVRKMIDAGFEVIGSDLASERLARARSSCPGARGFFASDLRQPALRPDSSECIYLGQVMEHLPDPGAVLAALRSALRPGGYLILDTPCRDNPIDDLIRLSGLARRYPGALDWGLHLDPGHLHFFRLREILGLLERSGYELLCSVGAPRLRWNTPRIGNPLASHRWLWKLHDFVEWGVGVVPRLHRTGAIVVCLARRPIDPPTASSGRLAARA